MLQTEQNQGRQKNGLFMNDFYEVNSMAYSERIIENAYVYEKCEQGFYRVINEDGDCNFLRLPQNYGVGDKGVLVYYSDGVSYGLTKFQKDDTIAIDFNKMKESYLKRWNTELKF